MGLVFAFGGEGRASAPHISTSKETRETEPDLYKICTGIIAYNYSSCNTLIASARKVFLDFLKRFLADYMLYAAGVRLRNFMRDAENVRKKLRYITVTFIYRPRPAQVLLR